MEELEQYLKSNRKSQTLTIQEIQNEVLTKLGSLLSDVSVITVKGGDPLPLKLPIDITEIRSACNYYLKLFNLAGFKLLIQNYIFNDVASKEGIDYEYPVYIVDEVGYRLSKRKEKIRPNQLIKFLGVESGNEIPNLHLTGEPAKSSIKLNNPEKIIDYFRRDVQWR